MEKHILYKIGIPIYRTEPQFGIVFTFSAFASTDNRREKCVLFYTHKIRFQIVYFKLFCFVFFFVLYLMHNITPKDSPSLVKTLQIMRIRRSSIPLLLLRVQWRVEDFNAQGQFSIFFFFLWCLPIQKILQGILTG